MVLIEFKPTDDPLTLVIQQVVGILFLVEFVYDPFPAIADVSTNALNVFIATDGCELLLG